MIQDPKVSEMTTKADSWVQKTRKGKQLIISNAFRSKHGLKNTH